MKVKIEIDVAPFVVPSRLALIPKISSRHDDSGDRETVAICDLDADTLLKLCKQFQEDVFRAARKSPPPVQG